MMNEMRDRLVELLNETLDAQYTKSVLITAEHTADHLIKNGVVVPPCKVGDVWTDEQGRKVAVEGLYVSELTGESVYFRYVDEDKYGDDLMAVNFIFWQHNFTKAEAEQKLKEMRGGND